MELVIFESSSTAEKIEAAGDCAESKLVWALIWWRPEAASAGWLGEKYRLILTGDVGRDLCFLLLEVLATDSRDSRLLLIVADSLALAERWLRRRCWV